MPATEPAGLSAIPIPMATVAHRRRRRVCTDGEHHRHGDREGPDGTDRDTTIVGSDGRGASHHTHCDNAIACAQAPTQRQPGGIVANAPAECAHPRIADAYGLGGGVGTALRRTEGEAQRTHPDGRRHDWRGRDRWRCDRRRSDWRGRDRWRCDRRGRTGGRRHRRRSPGWCEGRKIALGRLIVGNVIGRNEIVLRHGRRPDIETCLRSQRGERRRLARCLRAGLLTALIDAISCEVRFTAGSPRQRGSPCGTRPQHKHSRDGFYPVHTDTPIRFSPAAGTPFPEKPISREQGPLSDCRTDSVIQREIEKGKRSPLHCGNYARCVPSQEKDGQNKNPANEPWREKYLWWPAGKL
jgi:hypothetical protein